jgi:hypothetical protein
MQTNELNFLSGVDFSTPGNYSRLGSSVAKSDGYMVMANAGTSRKGDRCDISLAHFCANQSSVPQKVAIGVAGKDILFVLDSELTEHKPINLYVQPSTKIVASKPKVHQLFEVLGIDKPVGKDSYTVVPFNLVHMFGNIYKAKFESPNEVKVSESNKPASGNF